MPDDPQPLTNEPLSSPSNPPEPEADPAPRPTAQLPYARIIGLAVVCLVALSALGWYVMGTAHWAATRAHASYSSGNLEQALHWMDQAVERNPEDPAWRFERAVMRLEVHDLEGALEDLNRVIELSPSFATAYSFRATVHQRLGDHDAAIADYSSAADLRPEWDATSWNNLAYSRAIAGRDLEQALVEVQRALDRADAEERYMFLDTRGYIYYKLDQLQDALTDLDEAVRLGEEHRQLVAETLDDQVPQNPRRGQIETQLEEQLSVIYHHRGQVNERLGRQAQAGFDFRRADDLGYDPERGVY